MKLQREPSLSFFLNPFFLSFYLSFLSLSFFSLPLLSFSFFFPLLLSSPFPFFSFIPFFFPFISFLFFHSFSFSFLSFPFLYLPFLFLSYQTLRIVFSLLINNNSNTYRICDFFSALPMTWKKRKVNEGQVFTNSFPQYRLRIWIVFLFSPAELCSL